MKKTSVVTSILLAVVVLFNVPGVVFATPAKSENIAQDIKSDPNCWPLDVVLVVDQSGSMFSENGNDPEFYRFDAVREVLYELIQNRQDQCPQAKHRIGLVVFGNDARTYLALRPITIGPEDDPYKWADLYLEDIQRAQNSQSSKYTNFVAAFEEVKKIFLNARVEEDPDEYGPRRQIVIFLTDGKPTYGGSPSEQMCALKESLSDGFWDDKRIWIAALNARHRYLDEPSGCNGDTLREDLQDIAQSHQGYLREAPYNKQYVTYLLADIVLQEFGQNSERLTCDDIFYVEPYLDKVVFRFYRNKDYPNLRVTLTQLDMDGNALFELRGGQVIIPSVDETRNIFEPNRDYKVSQLKEVYTIYSPMPGPWRFTVDGLNEDACRRDIDANRVRFVASVDIKPQINDVLPVYSHPPYQPKDGNGPYIYVTLRDGRTLKPIEEEPGYPLLLTATWILPDGTSRLPNGEDVPELNFIYDLDLQSWKSQIPIPVPIEGVYTLELKGSVYDPNKDEEIVLFTEKREFGARKVEVLSFVALIDGESYTDIPEKLACNQIYEDGREVTKPLVLRIALLDEQGEIIEAPENYVVGLGNSFRVSVRDESGQVLDEVLAIKEQDSPYWMAELFADAPDGILTGCGRLNVDIFFEGNYDTESFSIPDKRLNFTLERERLKGVRLDILSPESEERFVRFAHPWDVCPERFHPVPVKIAFRDQNGETISPLSLMNDGEKLEQLIRVSLVREDTTQEVSMDFSVVKDGGTSLLQGYLTDIDALGVYKLVVQVNSNAVSSRGYVPIKSEAGEYAIEFERYDPWWASATICWGVRVLIVLLGVLLLGLLVYLFTGGPGGVIEIDGEKAWHLPKTRLGVWVRNILKYKYTAPDGVYLFEFSPGDRKGVVEFTVEEGVTDLGDLESGSTISVGDVKLSYYRQGAEDGWNDGDLDDFDDEYDDFDY